MNLVQQSADSDEERGYIYEGVHLLSLLHIRMGQVDRARAECEKALQARRRLLGKWSDASLVSTALMAHIYVLLNSRARAKSCLAMIPETRRSAVLKIVDESLGAKVERLDYSSPRIMSICEDSDLAAKPIQSRTYASPLTLRMENRCYGPVPAIVSQPSAANLQPSDQHISSIKAGLENLQSVTVTSLSSTEGRSESQVTMYERMNDDHSAGLQVIGATALSLEDCSAVSEALERKTLSRKEILDRVGCRPKDRIEEAVCDADHSAFASLLNKKNDFWRSKLRKRVNPERITALHFASLFGEIDMARRLLASNFDINAVPYGYTTSLTPLKFAIGARQVEMVEFLIANGAKPSELDTWSTLAGQLMNRSWLRKTMSEAEKDHVPNRMIEILRILLKHGWDINAPFEASGSTVLHQAVTFWTGSYRWDLKLRATLTTFLCERGADPFQTSAEGKTPYDMALVSGHQDLLLILDQGAQNRAPLSGPVAPFELSSEPGEYDLNGHMHRLPLGSNFS